MVKCRSQKTNLFHRLLQHRLHKIYSKDSYTKRVFSKAKQKGKKRSATGERTVAFKHQVKTQNYFPFICECENS